MKREQLQARCDPDTVDEVKAYQDEKGITKSEAVRRLIRAGLEAKANDDTGELQKAGQTAPILMILILGLLTFVLTAIQLIGGAI